MRTRGFAWERCVGPRHDPPPRPPVTARHPGRGGRQGKGQEVSRVAVALTTDGSRFKDRFKMDPGKMLWLTETLGTTATLQL